jgi:hypothetical protein
MEACMPVSTFAALTADEELTARLERIVQTRTGGRVRDLRIDLLQDQVIVTGVVPTYYTKQLVTHAVLEEVKDRSLSNAVDVE